MSVPAASNSSPSILLVTNDFGPRAGGIETFVIGLLERTPRGSVVVFTSSQPDSESYDRRWREEFGVDVIRDKSRILLPTPRVTRAAMKIIRERSITKVWFGAAAPLALMSRALRKAGAQRIVALTHGHEVWWSKVPPFTLLMREIGRSIDIATYLGEYTRNALKRCIPEEKLHHIAPGIDVTHFIQRDAQDLKEQLGLTERLIIISVGRLVHRKGQDRLIEAMPAIREKVPNAHLIFVGEGPYREKLTQITSQLNLEPHISFIGRINYADLPRYISMGDIFAMPSRDRLFGLEVEGLGIVYLEASACSLPVIAGNSGGAPDAVINGETGFVVDGEDVAEIASRVIELLTNPELRTAMGRRGREFAEAQWRWEIWSERFASLFDDTSLRK